MTLANLYSSCFDATLGYSYSAVVELKEPMSPAIAETVLVNTVLNYIPSEWHIYLAVNDRSSFAAGLHEAYLRRNLKQLANLMHQEVMVGSPHVFTLQIELCQGAYLPCSSIREFLQQDIVHELDPCKIR